MAAAGKQPVDFSTAMVDATVSAQDWLVIAPVALPIAGGALILMFRQRLIAQAWIAIFFLLLNLVLSAALVDHIVQSGPLTMTMGRWLPPFGISFSVDLTGAVLVLAASFVAVACSLYSLVEIDAASRRYGFYSFLVLMMAGVNGAFLTGDVFNLYVWFEVLLISSFGLIALGGEKRQLDGAVKYAFLNLIATTFFLVATGYLYGTFGTLNMADLTRKIAVADANEPLLTIAALFLVAFSMKAAAFPLSFWLPASYHTPRIVVSALFAGLLTKVGVYALLRILVMIFAGQREELSIWIALIAAATMFIGVFGALAQSDIRRLLGYLVIAGIGTMLAGVAVSGEYGLAGALSYAVHSMLVMAALYLIVGIAGQKTGSFDLRDWGGYYSAMPLFAFVFLVLAFAVAGLPPLSGFWPKLLLVKGAMLAGDGWLAAAILISALLSSIAIIRVWLHGFWRGGPQGTRDGAEAWKFEPLDRSVVTLGGASVAMLFVAVIVLGVYPEPLLATVTEAGKGLTDPANYIGSVFGDAR